MNWYLAKIVFQIICGDGNHKAQFDEQLRLIEASDATNAFYKAQNLGEAEEDQFLNQQEQLVVWKFINVAELYQLREMIDGAELYSRVQEYDDVENYTTSVHLKAENIKTQFTHRILELL